MNWDLKTLTGQHMMSLVTFILVVQSYIDLHLKHDYDLRESLAFKHMSMSIKLGY